MPVFLKGDKRVLFVHVPKTGGTSIERLFPASGWQMRWRATSGPMFELRRCSPQHAHATILELTFDVSAFDLVFMLVRDPLARFRSEYAMRNSAELRTDARSVEEWAEAQFAAYKEDPFIRDNHLRPQSEFYLPGAQVYHLEDTLEATVKDLNKRFGLGLNREVPRAMDRQARVGVPSSKVQLSPRLEEFLRDFYAEDFRRFGYSAAADSAAQPGPRTRPWTLLRARRASKPSN